VSLLDNLNSQEPAYTSFRIPSLNRLLTSSVNISPTPLSKTFSYDPIGNLLSKSDVGAYTYPAAGQPLPHAVMSVSGSTVSATFTYDADGNQTAGLCRDWRPPPARRRLRCRASCPRA
jgi:hypothetical protein